jgi:hypothetical protein
MQAPAKFRISSFQIVPFLRKKRTSPEKKTISLHQQISKEEKRV